MRSRRPALITGVCKTARSALRGRVFGLPMVLAVCVAFVCPLAEGLTEANDARSWPVKNITVTATKLPEELDSIPAMLSTVSGDELRARNAQDLREALSLLAGVDLSPGSDAGPPG